jgi:uncharacterized protein DUF6677
LQSRDQVTDDIATGYPDRHIPAEVMKPYPVAIRALAIIAAWAVPGAGHMVLGRFGRAALFFTFIVGSFFLGLSLHGRLYWPTVAEPPSALHFDLITVLWFFAQIGAGMCYIVSHVAGFGLAPHLEAYATYEYGNTFMFLAGLLNYLVIHDAFDIAAGRKR